MTPPMTEEAIARVEAIEIVDDWLSMAVTSKFAGPSGVIRYPPICDGELDAIRALLSLARQGLEMREALFMCATHCQGGHSDAGFAASKALGVPFPIDMESLSAKASGEGFDPDRLWPWYAKMRPDRATLQSRSR